ncbi:hypothetical protein Tco_1445364, partial [Tanacetum coccineum]
MSLRTTVLGQMSEIRELHDADHRRQAVTSEMLKADHRRSVEMRELRTADRDHLSGAGDSLIRTGGSIIGTTFQFCPRPENEPKRAKTAPQRLNEQYTT